MHVLGLMSGTSADGVEAVLVKKTKNTLWNPKSIDDIDFIELKNFFEFHTEKLNL